MATQRQVQRELAQRAAAPQAEPQAPAKQTQAKAPPDRKSIDVKV
jgi:hypothetical protein